MKIFNDQLEATFKTKGAELVSLKDKETGREYIWQADPDFWGRHSPILFPFVGKLKDDSYTYQDETYSLGQHGFVRDMEFNLIDQESERLKFSFTSIEQTMTIYPFRFELIIEYTLKESSLIVAYEVKNLASPDMFFSIGGHPGFNCPLIKGEARSDYWLEFEKDEKKPTWRIENGLFSGETEEVIRENKIRITNSLFDKDALIFKNLSSNTISLVSPSKRWLTLHFDEFPYLGIWSKSQESPFVCIEPWFGIADKNDHDHQIASKEGINVLKKDETFECSYQIDIH